MPEAVKGTSHAAPLSVQALNQAPGSQIVLGNLSDSVLPARDHVVSIAETAALNEAHALELLQELLSARAPAGQEEEVRSMCERELAKVGLR